MVYIYMVYILFLRIDQLKFIPGPGWISPDGGFLSWLICYLRRWPAEPAFENTKQNT